MTDRSIDSPGALPRRRSQGLIVRRVGEELAVYDTRSEQVTALDQQTALVWMAMEVPSCSADLATSTGLSVEAIELAAQRLWRAGLLDSGPGRRVLLKQIGAATALAPLLAVAAPTAAMASSWTGATVLHSCTNSTSGNKTIESVTITATLTGTVRSIPATFKLTQGDLVKTFSTPSGVTSSRTGDPAVQTLSLIVTTPGTANNFSNSGTIAVEVTLYAGSTATGTVAGTLFDTITFSANSKTCS